MSAPRRLRVRSWYPPFIALWTVFFVSIPDMLSLGGGGNFFEIVWRTEPFWRAAFPFLLFGPAPLLLLPFAMKLKRVEPV